MPVLENGTEWVDVLVVGAGSGGIGASLAAARLGCSVLLVEREPELGGNAVRAGVSCWEPGVGGTGIPFEIYCRLKRIPDAVGVYSYGRHVLWQDGPRTERYPGGEHVVDPHAEYLDTMQRHSVHLVSLAQDEAYCRANWHGVVFEPQAYVQVVREMLAETGRCRVCTETSFADVQVDRRRVTAVRLTDGRRILARSVIDCTGMARSACGPDANGCAGRNPGSSLGSPVRLSRRRTRSMERR